MHNTWKKNTETLTSVFFFLRRGRCGVERNNLPRGVKFSPGDVVITIGAEELFKGRGQELSSYVFRHLAGDWGEMSEHDKKINDEGLQGGEGRLHSSYTTSTGETIWIITEWDRSVTTVLLPEEY